MSLLVPSEGLAQADPRVTKSMETLKSMTAKLGASKCAKTRRQRPSSWQFWQDRRSSRSKQAKHTTAKCQFWERPIRAMNQQGKFRHSNWRLLCGLQEVTSPFKQFRRSEVPSPTELGVPRGIFITSQTSVSPAGGSRGEINLPSGRQSWRRRFIGDELIRPLIGQY